MPATLNNTIARMRYDMLKSVDKRKEDRYFTFGTVYNQSKQNIGFLVDISLNGMQLWIDNKYREDSLTHLIIKPIRYSQIDEFEIVAKEARRRPFPEFFELGVIIESATPKEALIQTVQFVKANFEENED